MMPPEAPGSAWGFPLARFAQRLLLSAVCCSFGIAAFGAPVDEIGAAIETALRPTDDKRRVRALERLVRIEGVDVELGSALLKAAGKRRVQLAILLGTATDIDALPAWILSDDPAVAPGSLSREILASAFLEKILVGATVCDRKVEPRGGRVKRGAREQRQRILAVVDGICQDPNWRTRRVAARLLSTIDAYEETPAFQVLRQDRAWPVRAHTAPVAVSEEPIKDGGRPTKLPMNACAEAARSLSLVDRLYCDESLLVDGVPDEQFHYRVRAKPSLLRTRRGSLVTTITRGIHNGAQGYQLRQETSVAGRYQNEEAFVDADGLFSYEYRLTTRKPDGGHRQHVVLWDHFGRRIYLSKVKDDGATQYSEWDVGVDERADSRDPLSAMLLYRLMCSKQAKIVDWRVPVLMSRDERYNVSIQASKGDNSEKPASVVWDWKARDCDEIDKTVTSWFTLGPCAIPVRYAAHVWGVKGTATLTKHMRQTEKPAPVARPCL
jgi:hypothetical protein